MCAKSSTVQDLFLSGKVVNYGSSGTYELRLAGDGRFQEICAGLPECIGFDGNTGWVSDHSGLARELSPFELAWFRLRLAAITSNWAIINDLFEQSEISVDQASNGETVMLSHRKLCIKARILRDRLNHQIRELERLDGMNRELISFEGHKEFKGKSASMRIRQLINNFEVREIVLSSIDVLDDKTSDMFAKPANASTDFVINGDVPSEIEVKRTLAGHILIRPAINDEQLGWFFLDTCASTSTIDKNIANKLDLEAIAEIPLLSIFGTEKSTIRRAENLQVGPITIRDVIFAEMDLNPVNEALGEKIEGVIGYPLFARAIVEVDVKGSRVRILPEVTPELAKTDWIPMIFDNNHPVIEAVFAGGHQGLFRLDIGAGGNTVLFHTPVVEELNLLKNRAIADEQAVGDERLVFGELEWLEVAGHRFETFMAGFSQAQAGPFADSNTAGNIGLGLLSDYLLLFDYANSRLAFFNQKEL